MTASSTTKQSTFEPQKTKANQKDEKKNEDDLSCSFKKITTTPDYSNPKIAALRDLLDKTIKLVLQDGRVVLGKLYCVDWKRNIILRDAYQAFTNFYKVEISSNKKKPEPGLSSIRNLGSILVSYDSIVDIYLAHYPKDNTESSQI